MKECSCCKQTLPFEYFDKQSTGKDGYRADCKVCKKRFIRSKEGLIKECYATQKSKAKKRGYAPPAYTEKELLDWSKSNPEFHLLFEAWEQSGYKSNFKPSFDRLNDYISYRLDNLQVVTWNENNQKGYSDRTIGANNKKTLAVDMLDLDGNFIQRFHSVSAAAREFKGLPSNIIGAINQRVSKKRNPNGTTRLITATTAYGHKWRYSTSPNDNQEKT